MNKKNIYFIGIVVIFLNLGGCVPLPTPYNISALLEPEAGDSVAPLNKNPGKQSVHINADVSQGLNVALQVIYSPLDARTKKFGCYYTANWLEGASFSRKRTRYFSLRKGINSIDVNTDDVLPGDCNFQPEVMVFKVVDEETKLSGPDVAVYLKKDGIKIRSREIIKCGKNKEHHKGEFWCEDGLYQLHLPIGDPRWKVLLPLQYAPVSIDKANIDLVFQLD